MICNKLQDCVIAEFSGNGFPKCTNKNKEFCIESSDKRKFVKCEERGKKYTLENTKKDHVISYKMDGGVIVVDKTVAEGTNKCDYLYVLNSEKTDAILIELKGVDISKALKQIKGTLTIYKDFFSHFQHVYGRIVVTSTTPNLKASPEYVNLVKQFKTYHGNIKINKQSFEEKDVDLSTDN